MTAIVFALSWFGSWAWYSAYGPFLWKGGPTVYIVSMWAVLATASIAAALNMRNDRSPFYAALIMIGVVLFGWHAAWSWGPPGALRMIEHIGLGLAFLWFGSKRWQHVIGFLFLLGAAMSAAAVLGLWPSRPRVFTGFYYADAVAYLTHAVLIIIGRAAHDDAGIGGRIWALGHRRRLRFAGMSRNSVAVQGQDTGKEAVQ